MLGKSIESEKHIERLLVNLVKKQGGLCIKLVTTFFSGLPDRLVLLPGGIMFFVETKSTGVSARKLQLVVHKTIQKLGFTVYVPDNVDDVRNIIKKYSDYASKNKV